MPTPKSAEILSLQVSQVMTILILWLLKHQLKINEKCDKYLKKN